MYKHSVGKKDTKQKLLLRLIKGNAASFSIKAVSGQLQICLRQERNKRLHITTKLNTNER